MGTETTEIKVNDHPIFAKSDDPVAHWVRHFDCAACGSANTYCVYDHAEGAIIGWTIIEEYKCKDCGKFSARIVDYES